MNLRVIDAPTEARRRSDLVSPVPQPCDEIAGAGSRAMVPEGPLADASARVRTPMI